MSTFTAYDRKVFFAAYVECALWSSTAMDETDTPLDSLVGMDDLSTELMAQMLDDCNAFLDANEVDLDEMGDLSQAGHDFWLTRNRHGAGFWDRGLGALGERLSEASKAYGEVDLYIGNDGKVYA